MDDRTLFKFSFNRQSSQQVLGLEIQPDCINGVLLSCDGKQRPRLCKKISHPYSNKSMLSVALSHVVDEAKSALCCVTLASSFYQLLLLDAPEVEARELGEAMKWKIAEINNRDANELVVDAFRLPVDAYRGRLSMCYSAVTDKTFIKEIADVMASKKTMLLGISINELCIAQLIKNLPAFQGLNMVLVKPDKTGGMLCLMDSAQLYLCRTLEGNFSHGNGLGQDDSLVEGLALDIQRSMDYYESQLGKESVEMGFILLDGEAGLQVIEQLNEKLAIPITPFILNDLFENSEELCDPKFAPAIGAAFLGLSETYVSKN